MIKEQRILIYFDELVMSLTKAYGNTMDTHIYSPRDILSCMQGIRPVDAVEVVHGHMVERIVDHECPWYTVYDCSECGCTVEKWHSYCPNCGAKMDGDGNGFLYD